MLGLSRKLAQPQRVGAARHVHMSASEALVETLARHNVDKIWGIVGSAFIDPLDLFPAAGIKFIDVQHEQNAVHIADAYARVTGKNGIVLAQNGPGVSHQVSGIATAFYNHAPVTIITPQAGTPSIGLGGFQEIDQMPMFANMTKWQVHVPNASRVGSLTSEALNRAVQYRGPTQVNIPRDYFYDAGDFATGQPWAVTKPVPSSQDLEQIVSMLRSHKKIAIIAGYGVLDSEPVARLAELIGAPVCTSYLHNDVFPADHPLFMGALGYMGSKAAMKSIEAADVVLALGTRLNPFGTTAQYGMQYWDASKPLIQIDIDPASLGRSCSPTLACVGDASRTADALVAHITQSGFADSFHPTANAQWKKEWDDELERTSQPVEGSDEIRPKTLLLSIKNALKGLNKPIVTTDIGHCCSQALSYLEFQHPNSLLTAGTYGSCGTAIPAALGARWATQERDIVALVGDGAALMQCINELATAKRNKLGITVVVFKNRQWGAEKLNQLIWTDSRIVASNIEDPISIAGVARSFGAEGHYVQTIAEFEEMFAKSVEDQRNGITTLLEVEVSEEMGAPFRSDAMKPTLRNLDKYKHLTTTESRFIHESSPADEHKV